MGLNVAILPVVTKDLPSSIPGSRPTNFYRDATSALFTTRQPMIELILTGIRAFSAHLALTPLRLLVYFRVDTGVLDVSMGLNVAILPVVTKDLPSSIPGSRPTNFYRDATSALFTTRQPMIEFDLLAFPRFPLRKKEQKSYFGKNRTHDFRSSRCAGHLLDHSGDEG